jgi:hypothetical protein
MNLDRASTNSDLKHIERRKKVSESLSGQLRLSVAISEGDGDLSEADETLERRILTNSKLKSKSYSRLFSDLSLHVRAIDESCSKYEQQQQRSTAEKGQNLPPRPPRSSRSHQTIDPTDDFYSIPPPPPPPLLLPSPRSSPNSHQHHRLEQSLLDNSILSPLTTPPPSNKRQQDTSLPYHRELFSESSATETSFKQQSSNPANQSFSLDSPSPESSNSREKRRFQTATHFLVPGGLSTHHPSLSPQSPTSLDTSSHGKTSGSN